MGKTNISIIIPVYKAEDFIERCVVHLMEQTIKDSIEFIFINDCTPDDSIQILKNILEKYPHRKSQVSILKNEKNMGAAYSKLKGLQAAKGNYIGWCDSDDWVEYDMYEKMWEATNNGLIDIVICDYYKEYIDGTKYIHINPSKSPDLALMNSWKANHLPSELPIQLTRKSIIDQAAPYIIHTKQGEDTYLKRYIFSIAETINFVNKPLYHYDSSNTSSITHNSDKTIKEWEKHKQNITKISEFLYNKENGFNKYHLAVNYLKYNRKNQYSESFNNIFQFYFTFPECYKDINTLTNNTKSKIRSYIIFNCFPLFLLYFNKTWKCLSTKSSF